MTTFSPICSYCAHFDTSVRDREVCSAFPDGIPQSILTGKLSHHFPVKGDRGIQFTPVEGFEHLSADNHEVM